MHFPKKISDFRPAPPPFLPVPYFLINPYPLFTSDEQFHMETAMTAADVPPRVRRGAMKWMSGIGSWALPERMKPKGE